MEHGVIGNNKIPGMRVGGFGKGQIIVSIPPSYLSVLKVGFLPRRGGERVFIGSMSAVTLGINSTL